MGIWDMAKARGQILQRLILRLAASVYLFWLIGKQLLPAHTATAGNSLMIGLFGIGALVYGIYAVRSCRREIRRQEEENVEGKQ